MKNLIYIFLFFCLNINAQTVKYLNDLKAFPSAFGYGQNVTGGRGGTIIEVTNLNDSGAGSLRDALNQTYPREIFVKVAGIVTLSSMLYIDQDNDDFTLIGQTAPGQGLTITGHRVVFSGLDNFIIRHVTFRTKNDAIGQVDTVGITDDTASQTTGGYFDHCSFSWGYDEVVSITVDNSLAGYTLAYCILAENDPAHNTGSIMGGSTSEPIAGDGANVTWSRNMTYNISHRFPNSAGVTNTAEAYNNLIVNWQNRLARINGNIEFDWYNNYAYAGNKSKATDPVNKYSYNSSATENNASIYTKGNYIEGILTDTTATNQTIWQYFLTRGGKTAGVQVEPEFFTGTRQATSDLPLDGVWTAIETFDNLMDNVGHNRGTDSSGNPMTGQNDDIDSGYFTKINANTTESTYLATTEWALPTITGGTDFTDADNDGMSDTFESTHGITSGTAVKTNWDFGTYELVNNAGYNNREIYWAYVAGDFDLLEGVDLPLAQTIKARGGKIRTNNGLMRIKSN